MTILAVFRSRTQALDALGRASGRGIAAQTVSTPKDAGCGCGLSVRFDARFYPTVAALVRGRAYSSFAGFFRSVNGRYVRI